MQPAQQGIAGLNAGNMGFMDSAMGGISQQEKLREIDILNAYFRQANIPPQQSLKMLPPNAAQGYFFTVDKTDGFIEAVKQLLGELKQSGVQAIYLNKVDPSIVQALQSAGAAPQQSDKPEYKLMAAI